MADITNPPAYPSAEYADWKRSGMDLRDWFAGQALAGLFANPDAVLGDTVAKAHRGAATLVYQMADAMLAVRKKGGAE